MRRKLIALIAAVLMLCCTGLTVFATPDAMESGTISLTTTPDGEVTIYRVGDLAETDGTYSFVLVGDYAESDLSLDDLQSPELADKLTIIAETDTTGIKKAVDADGKVTFEVEAGLYLLVQTKAGKNGLFSPFLISMPNWKDGIYTNEVDATPKVSIAPEKDETAKPGTTPGTRPGTSGGTSGGTTSGGRLPQTGQLNWPVPLLACAGLLLFIVGIGLRRGKETQ